MRKPLRNASMQREEQMQKKKKKGECTWHICQIARKMMWLEHSQGNGGQVRKVLQGQAMCYLVRILDFIMSEMENYMRILSERVT